MTNIKNNNYRKIDCRLINDEYMDFMLSKDEIIDDKHLLGTCLAANLNFFNHNSKHVVSDIVWDKAVASDKVLKNIGYTGVDNGFISYERDRIGNDEFLDLYTKSSFDLSTYANKFFVTEVNGNSGTLTYPIEVKSDYTTLKGGFYQGFFKVNGDKYQTLPHRIDNEWNFNITLRKKDYETPSNILNKKHTNNIGFFFFIGTRAENKFWELYKVEDKIESFKYNNSDDYTIMDCDVIETQYTKKESDCEGDIHNELCGCNNYFADDGYLKEQISLKDLKLIDSKDNIIGEKGFYEIETDNKFIIFNNTKSGYNKNTWNDYYKFVLYGKKDWPNINYFPYLNHSSSGYSKDNIETLIQQYSYAYDIFKDIKTNALGFKINDDGSISYRYLVTDDEIIEETSKPNLIKKDEWSNIHIKIICKKTDLTNDCDKYYKANKMQIYIYVNGLLKLISKELPELILKSLNDTPERQEGVPYNISIGGGTQGLCDRILLDYYDRTDYVLPLEKYFGGTFIGDIKNFTFTPCIMEFPTIYQKRNDFNLI